MNLLFCRTFVAAAAVATAALGVSQTTIVVSPNVMNGWIFAPENTVGGQSGALVMGPDVPPAGTGSARFVLTAANQGMLLGTNAYAGTPLTQITTLKYSTYRAAPATGAPAPALQFNVDFDGTGNFQGRLVFEPYQTPGNTVVTGQWQEWNALAGRWWATRAPYNTIFGQSNPMTLQQILAHYPLTRIRPGNDGPILFKVGSGWTFDGNVDKFTIGVNGVETTYDFEGTDPDSDGDGVPDYLDQCPNSDLRPYADTGGGATSVENAVDAHGCTIQDHIEEAWDNASNHGQYVVAIRNLARALGLNQRQTNEFVNGAAHRR